MYAPVCVQMGTRGPFGMAGGGGAHTFACAGMTMCMGLPYFAGPAGGTSALLPMSFSPWSTYWGGWGVQQNMLQSAMNTCLPPVRVTNKVRLGSSVSPVVWP